MEKGIGSEKTFSGKGWASSRIPDVSGMLPDVFGMSGTIKTEVPLRPRPVCLLPNSQSTPFFPPRVTVEFHQEKREREIALEKACIKIEGPGTWISSHSRLFSKGTLIADLVRSTWLKISFEIPSVNMLH